MKPHDLLVNTAVKAHIAYTQAVHSPHVRHKMRWALFHVAFVVFCCDLVAAIWPSFDHLWKGVAHLGVALGTFLASMSEWISGLEETELRKLAHIGEVKK